MIPYQTLIVDNGLDDQQRAKAQKKIALRIHMAEEKVSAIHPPYSAPSTKEEWWSTVDEYWQEIINLVAYELDTNALADEEGRPSCDVTAKPLCVVLYNLRIKRSERIHNLLEDIWLAAPDTGEIHARPGWGVLCDLCSESHVLFEDNDFDDEDTVF